MFWCSSLVNTTPVAFLFLSPKKQVNTDLRQIIILHALSASGVQQHAPGGTGMVWSITLQKTRKGRHLRQGMYSQLQVEFHTVCHLLHTAGE